MACQVVVNDRKVEDVMRENYCNESILCKGAPVPVRLFPKDPVYRITYRRSVS
jgi:hypothetical protein